MGRPKKITKIVDAKELEVTNGETKEEYKPEITPEIKVKRKYTRRVKVLEQKPNSDLNAMVCEFQKKKSALVDRYMRKILKAMIK